MAGVSPLFTRDFFALARDRLAEGGLFCQWAHIYNMAPRRPAHGGGRLHGRVPAGGAVPRSTKATCCSWAARGPCRSRIPRRSPRAWARRRCARTWPACRCGPRSAWPACSPPVPPTSRPGRGRGAPHRRPARARVPRRRAPCTPTPAARTGRRSSAAPRPATAPEPFRTLKASATAEGWVERARMLEEADSLPPGAGRVPARGGAAIRAPSPRSRASCATALFAGQGADAGSRAEGAGLRTLAGERARGAGAALPQPGPAGRGAGRARRRPRSATCATGAPCCSAPRCRREAGNFEAARGLAEAALQIAPDDADARALVGLCPVRGRRAGARRWRWRSRRLARDPRCGPRARR